MKLSKTSIAVLVGGVAVCVALGWFGIVGFGGAKPVSTASNSMSHSDGYLPGILDPGEMVVATGVLKKEDVVTHVTGRSIGHERFGDWGDVIVFRGRGEDGLNGIIHRAIAWVEYNPEADAYDVPELGLAGVRSFVVPQVGTWDTFSQTYVHIDLPVVLDPDAAGRHSGFLTKGDHNFGFDQDARGGLQSIGRTELVPVEDIQGKAVRHVDREHARLTGGIALAFAVVGSVGYLYRRNLRAAIGDRLLRSVGACDACGKRLRRDDVFCRACGAERAQPAFSTTTRSSYGRR